MKKSTRKICIIVLGLAFGVGVTGMLWSLAGYGLGAQDYSAAEDLADIPAVSEPDRPATKEPNTQVPEDVPQEPTNPYAAALLETDLTALQEVNPDILGWIQIPDMELSYPLVQGTDNEYYLNHTWKNKRSSVGAVYMDYRNSKDLSDFNTVIYGHNMKNGSMFGQLDRFEDAVYLEEHPYVYIVDETGCRRYRIFAAYNVSVATAEAYQMQFSDVQDRQAFIETCLDLSAVDSGTVPTDEERIITLSTCTGWGYSYRWVVQAALDLQIDRKEKS